jgi:hypothetical protein
MRDDARHETPKTKKGGYHKGVYVPVPGMGRARGGRVVNNNQQLSTRTSTVHTVRTGTVDMEQHVLTIRRYPAIPMETLSPWQYLQW